MRGRVLAKHERTGKVLKIMVVDQLSKAYSQTTLLTVKKKLLKFK